MEGDGTRPEQLGKAFVVRGFAAFSRALTPLGCRTRRGEQTAAEAADAVEDRV